MIWRWLLLTVGLVSILIGTLALTLGWGTVYREDQVSGSGMPGRTYYNNIVPYAHYQYPATNQFGGVLFDLSGNGRNAVITGTAPESSATGAWTQLPGTTWAMTDPLPAEWTLLARAQVPVGDSAWLSTTDTDHVWQLGWSGTTVGLSTAKNLDLGQITAVDRSLFHTVSLRGDSQLNTFYDYTDSLTRNTTSSFLSAIATYSSTFSLAVGPSKYDQYFTYSNNVYYRTAPTTFADVTVSNHSAVSLITYAHTVASNDWFMVYTNNSGSYHLQVYVNGTPTSFTVTPTNATAYTSIAAAPNIFALANTTAVRFFTFSNSISEVADGTKWFSHSVDGETDTNLYDRTLCADYSTSCRFAIYRSDGNILFWTRPDTASTTWTKSTIDVSAYSPEMANRPILGLSPNFTHVVLPCNVTGTRTLRVLAITDTNGVISLSPAYSLARGAETLYNISVSNDADTIVLGKSI